MNNYFRRLVEYDLVERTGNEYHIADPVLALWIRYALLERTPEYETFHRSAETYLAQLRERVASLSRDLGQAQESVVREVLRRLSGRTVDARWFGRSGRLTVPLFEQVDRYRSPDGQIEVDALAESAGSDERWVVEVKWRNRAVGLKELEALQRKAEALHARGWCISRLGFTAEALEWAKAQGILLSTAADLDNLAREVS